MKIAHRILLAALLVSVVAFVLAAQPAQSLRVAAAADLKFVMPQLVAEFQKQTGTRVDVSYGSSGNFFAQIQNGAPFDLFFSADIDYPRKLQAAGLTGGELYEYAVGKIVLWAPPNSSLKLAESGWKALQDPAVKKISIANPAHAPYGRAAVAALKKEGIYEQVKGKLVYGENISQAAEFVQSGNAQVGIVALSLALSPPMAGGRRWEVPVKDYPPIDQAVVVIKKSANPQAAKAFLAFVKSPGGQEILKNFGFVAPSTASH